AHPGKDEASSAAYDVHFSLVFLDLFNGLTCDAAVQRHKVHAVLRVQADNVNKIFGGECGEISLIVDHAVIDRHRTDHDRAFSRQLLAEGLCVPMAGEVHDRLCSEIDGAHHLLHLDVIVLAVSRYAEIDVDLCAEHAAHALRIQAGVALVGADRHLALCHELH